MKLRAVIKGIETLGISGDAGADISGISYDSRRVEQGHLFAALPGEKSDGHDFIGDAIRKGAVAIMYEKAEFGNREKERPGKTVKISEEEPDKNVVFIRVRDTREALALAANNFLRIPT